MKRRQGGISVFLAIVFLTLITFVLSIVEVTRYQILQVQAEQILISSTQSVLAGYDSALKNEYGIFARNPEYGDCSFVAPDFPREDESPMESDFRYYAEKHDGGSPLSLENYEIRATGLLAGREGIDYVKKDMVDYMTLRMPMVAVTSILESLSATEKMGKTTEFVKGKNEQVEKAAEIEASYEDLYLLLDGVKLNRRKGTSSVTDSNFMNRLLVDDQTQYLENLPQPLLEQAPASLNLVADVTNSKRAYEDILASIEGIGDVYREYLVVDRELSDVRRRLEAVREAIDDVEDDIDDVNDDIDDEQDEAYPNDAKIRRLKRERRSHKDNLRNLEVDEEILEDDEEALNETYVLLISDMSRRIHAIDNSHHSIDKSLAGLSALVKGKESHLNIANKTVETIESMQKKADQLTEDIDGFIASGNQSKEDYMSSVYNASLTELEAIKSNYGSGGEDYFDADGNILFIGEIAQSNLKALQSLENSALHIADGYVGHLMHLFMDESLDQKELKDLIETTGQPALFFDRHLSRGGWLSSKDGLDFLGESDLVLTGLSAYRTIPHMTYEDYREKTDENSPEFKIWNNLKDMMEAYSLENLTSGLGVDGIVLPEGLPSELYGNTSVSEGTGAIAVEGNLSNEDHVYLDRASGMDRLTAFTGHASEQILVNEYAIGMFRSYPGKNRNPQRSLSGYEIYENHPLDTELEYIYTGNNDSGQALLEVAAKIYGVRVAFNLVHLVSDGAKRTTINQVAAIVAGWWSLGSATFLVAAGIALLWAMVEALVDTEILLSGGKAALVKTSGTWHTSLEGMAQLAANEIKEIAGKASAGLIETCSREIKLKAASLGAQLEESASEAVDDKLNALLAKGEQLAGVAEDAFDEAYYGALDATVAAYRDGITTVDVTPYLDPTAPGYDLIKGASDTLMAELEAGGQRTYGALVEVRMGVSEQFHDVMKEKKEAIGNQVKDHMSGVINQGLTTLNNEVDKLAQQGEAMTAKGIDGWFQTVSEEMSDHSAADAKDKEIGKDMLVPEVGYEMYIRMFMLLEHDQLDQRIIRMVDLMDYNLATAKYRVATGSRDVYAGREHLSLAGYSTGLEATGIFSLPYFSINMNAVSPALLGPSNRGSYSIEKTVVNNYE